MLERASVRRLLAATRPGVLPVIHGPSSPRTAVNIDRLTQAGAEGCFPINHNVEAAGRT